jgi:adenylylsulfate kinase
MEKTVQVESKTRSLLKALSWRIIATTTTMGIAYTITGEIKTAATIGGIEFFAKFAIYYLHERAWQLAPRGSIRKMLGLKK